ncbi:hypothetical protein K7X08_032932 [Anisodus acutangulus]|uniref:Expansin n=1 Tax=Anisodus acutangulus TaxID=402998 RepID=A0A9Q1R9N1_9SOLA|nr:hypothetical protein K7X08_032932 [Anisodus acutangulus]
MESNKETKEPWEYLVEGRQRQYEQKNTRWNKTQEENNKDKAKQYDRKLNIRSSRSNKNLVPQPINDGSSQVHKEVVQMVATTEEEAATLSKKQRKFQGKLTIPIGVLFEGEVQHVLTNGEILTIKGNKSMEWPQIDIQSILRKSAEKLKVCFFHNFQQKKCKKEGGVRFTINGAGIFLSVLISNVAGVGDIVAAKVKGSRTGWLAMGRIWGQNWHISANLKNQPLSFEITSSDGVTLTSYNVAPRYWSFGQTFQGKQFES